MNDLSPEDRTILAALESLETGGGEPPAPGEGTEAAETLARLYTEVLGLVPCELEPAAPRPEVKARLLSAIRGDETLPGDETQEMDPRPEPVPPPSSPVRPVPVPRPATSKEMPVAPRVVMMARRRNVWPMALAATLILALGGLCGWLYLRQARMEETIARLETELATERREAEQAVPEMQAAMERMQAAMERMRVNLALVTSPAVKVSPLRPVDRQSPARGILFVAADSQHWYLAIHDLPPAPQGRDYQLWWIARDGTIRGGVFDPAAGEKVEHYSETMPDGTRDVMITLEPDRGSPSPTGPEVLQGGDFVQL